MQKKPAKKVLKHIAVLKETILVLIRFRVQGNLRFISHAEMLKVFQRACVRAGIKIQHSGGFNPRPKLSLPLPRPVGVETDDDLLCLRMNRDQSETQATSPGPCSRGGTSHERRIKSSLSGQLPEGLELLSVSIAEADTSFWPCAATYVLVPRHARSDGKLKARIERLLTSESLVLRRPISTKKSKFKNVDVRGFLKSIELDDRGIGVECKVSSAGTIRVEEILKLLELSVEELAAPIRRTNVKWQEKCS